MHKKASMKRGGPRWNTAAYGTLFEDTWKTTLKMTPPSLHFFFHFHIYKQSIREWRNMLLCPYPLVDELQKTNTVFKIKGLPTPGASWGTTTLSLNRLNQKKPLDPDLGQILSNRARPCRFWAKQEKVMATISECFLCPRLCFQALI